MRSRAQAVPCHPCSPASILVSLRPQALRLRLFYRFAKLSIALAPAINAIAGGGFLHNAPERFNSIRNNTSGLSAAD